MIINILLQETCRRFLGSVVRQLTKGADMESSQVQVLLVNPREEDCDSTKKLLSEAGAQQYSL